MAGFGIVEIIALLLSLSGFGVRPNPKPMTADQALEFAIADADVVAEIDLASIVPGNYKVLTELPDQPPIKASPALAKLVRDALNEVEGARGAMKSASGIDVTTDLTDATVFVQLVPNAQPSFVAAFHGKLSPAVITRIAEASHRPAQKVGGGMMIENGGDPALGVTKSGVLLAGDAALVRERLGVSWKAPSHAAGTNLGYAAEVIGAKPILAVVMTMSKAARELAGLAVGQNFLGDVIHRHKAAAFVVYRDGLGWMWADTTKGGFDSMAMVSDGMLDVMRAAQIAPRGLAKIAIGGLDSYRGQDKLVDDLISHKDDILKLVTTYTGDGNFKVTQSKDAGALKLTVRATGKSLSEVLPAGLIVPLAIVGFLTVHAPPPPVMMPAQKPALTPPHK